MAAPTSPRPSLQRRGEGKNPQLLQSPWQRIGLAGGILVFLALALVPSGLHRIEGFGSRPAYAAAVAALMAVWWFTEALPMAWTAAVPLVLFPILGVFDDGFARSVFQSGSPYIDAYIFLFLGGMMIGAAMEQWNLHRRIALHIMRFIGTDPKRLLLGVLVATATVSLWISNTATAVMMMPIGMALIAQLETELGGRRLNHFGSAIMLAVAYAANVGGIGTKIGTGTNSIFCGFLSEKLGVDLSFAKYMAFGVPFVVLFIPIVWLVLWRKGRKDEIPGGQGRAVLDRELAALGPMKREEKIIAMVFGLAAILWIAGNPLRQGLAPFVPEFWTGFRFQGKHYESWVAMSAGLSLVAMRLMSLRSIRRLPWGTLVLLGGSFAMASGIEESGLSAWMAEHMRVLAKLPLLGQIGLTSLATVLLSAVASNTATVNVMLNVLPRSLPVLSASAMAASCDFMLPAGTPPNAIVFGSGYIRLPDMMRTGFVLDVSAAVLVTLYVNFYVRTILF